jgi:hypothetical protein
MHTNAHARTRSAKNNEAQRGGARLSSCCVRRSGRNGVDCNGGTRYSQRAVALQKAQVL